MHARHIIKAAYGIIAYFATWFVGNIVYFNTWKFWQVSQSYQENWIVVLCCSSVAVYYSYRSKGSIQDRFHSVLNATVLVFGLYALFVLVGRQFFSRSIMISMFPATLAVGLLAAWIKHRQVGFRIGVVAPLVKQIPEGMKGADVITHPHHDFSKYDALLVDLHEQVSGDWAKALSRAMLSGCRVKHIYEHFEDVAGAVSLDHFEIEHVEPERGSYGPIKRTVDVLTTIALLPLIVPVVLIAGLCILASSGSPMFFVQDRMGRGGVPFQMWKLRTMRPAENNGEEREALPGDSRVTGIGRVLRRARIDELPQLWNVLKGDMSLIGPRPEVVTFHNNYTDVYPKFAYRCLVRPGISGWAQVNVPPSANADEAALKLAYDLYYIKRQSAALDLLIALRTVWTVTHGSGVR